MYACMHVYVCVCVCVCMCVSFNATTIQKLSFDFSASREFANGTKFVNKKETFIS